MNAWRIPRDRRGFTLIELMVVLAVVWAMAAMGMPSLQLWRSGFALRKAATGLSQAMLSARMNSIVERRNYTVTVDYAADTCTVSPAPASPQAWSTVDLYPDSSDPECLSLSSRDVVFQPNSSADAAGYEAVYLRSKDAKVGVRYRVKVLGATGRISVEKWVGGEWRSA